MGCRGTQLTVKLLEYVAKNLNNSHFPKCKELSHFNKMCDVALHDIKYDPRGLFLENSLNFNCWNNYYYYQVLTPPGDINPEQSKSRASQ